MAGLGGRLLLGAATGMAKGYGDGMAAKGAFEGKAKYDSMMLQAKSGARMNELAVQHGFQSARDNEERKFKSGENDKTRQANITMAGMKGGQRGLLTPQQVFNMAKTRHTTEDPVTMVKATDWDKVQVSMDDAGYGDVGRQIIGGNPQGPGNPGLDQETAFKRAQAEAEDKNPTGPDWMRPGGMKEAYGDKSQEEWTTERARALMGGQDEIAPSQGGKTKTQEASAAQPYKGATPPPGYQNAKQAKDGNWYVKTGGGWMMVTMGSVAGATDESVKDGLDRKHQNY